MNLKYPEDFEIVFSGGPLLPPRRSKPPRWWTMGNRAVGSAEDAADPKEAQRLKEAMRPKRQYNRKKHVSVQNRPVDPAGQPPTTGIGDRGQPAEPLPDSATHQERTT